MGKIKTALCYLDSRDVKKLADEIIEQISHPRYFCKRCVRVATDRDLLCRPKRLPSK